MATGPQHSNEMAWRGATEQDLLGLPAVPQPDAQPHQGWQQSAAGRLTTELGSSARATSAVVPYQLVDLVKPGPSGTVASAAAAASAAHAAAIKAAPDVGPGGLLATMSAANQRRQPGLGGALQDLIRAAEKAMASGLGDWHLQALQDISPQFQEHVLMGALGPENLKHKHKLPEQQILQLYGLLHRHCMGFQQEVQAALLGAAHPEQLLASIWTAFAQLWDECVQVTFQGEVRAAMQELQGTYAALLDTQDALAATQQENEALKERCNDFVKANLDHMLAWRALKTKADALEGEVSMLSSANSEISLRAAATNARNTQLTVQLEGLGARLAGAEQQIKEREASLAVARVALMEKDSGLCRLEAQVAALEQQLMAAGHTAKRQDSSISDLLRQLEDKGQLVQDAERRVADKQRAYNLLHADFVKQKAEAADAAEAAESLKKQLTSLQQQLTDASSLIAKAEGWRKRWEVCQMEVEDLQSANARATRRRCELVSSYWPVMQRLGRAEDVVQALTQQVQGLGQQPAASLEQRDARAVDVLALRASPAGAQGTDSNTGSSSSSSSSNKDGSTAGSDQVSIMAQQQSVPATSAAAVADRIEITKASSDTASNISSSSSSIAGGPSDLRSTVADASGNVGLHEAAQQLPQGTIDLSGMNGIGIALKQELQHLQENYLMLQDAYWGQKERLMALELEAGQLRVSSDNAIATAAKATSALSEAQEEAAKHASKCTKLEADIVGCKSWIRELEVTEQAYLKAMREQGALEDAALTAQRQLSDCRMALAAAEASSRVAQAAAEAVGKERTQLLGQLAQEMNKSTMIEQALQKVHKQELSSSRAACARLQAQLDQQALELATVQARLADVQKQYVEATKSHQQLNAQLQYAEQKNSHFSHQLQQVLAFLSQTLQRLEGLESRLSYISTTSVNGSIPAAGQTVEVAVEAAVHLLERLLVSLQCLAADAGTISNAASAAKVEVLVRSLMQGLEDGLAGKQGLIAKQGAAAAAASLTVLRNAAGATNKQRVQELEQHMSVLQLQLSDSTAQLSAAVSSGARLQRALQLKTRAVASLERQLAAAESQMQHLHADQAGKDRTILQLQQELAEAQLDHAQLSATATARAGELAAASSRAAANEAEMQQQQAVAAEAAAACTQLHEKLQEAVEASRRNALEASTSASTAAAATLQVQQLTAQLAAATEQCTTLEAEVQQCRQHADIATQHARNADYARVQTTTLLADARRALDFTQRLLLAKEEEAPPNSTTLEGS